MTVDLVADVSPVHLIGIGGAGMSALARVLLSRGVTVSGSDLKDHAGLTALRALGARICIGHDANNVADARAVVVSSAIRATNPELMHAREGGLLVLHRAQMLAMLMRDRRGIVVAGTHGKTTTTSMVALGLQSGGLDPSFLIGGDLNERGTNAHHGRDGWIVVEADESDGSFLWLTPEVAVVTNIEAEHLDHYRDEAEVRETFLAFMDGVSIDGVVVACADDRGVRAVLARVSRRIVTYGLDDGDWRGTRHPDGTLSVHHAGEVVATLIPRAPGAHNARNILAALAASAAAGVDPAAAAVGIAAFAGPQRRFQRKGDVGGISVVDEYAHHPTEVRAALAAAREQAAGRVVAIFQPHLYSRTRFFGHDLGVALAAADLVVVTDIFGSREDPEPGVTGKLVVDGVGDADPRRRVAYLPKRADIVPYVVANVRPGDMVLTIGAGDVTMLGEQILVALSERAS